MKEQRDIFDDLLKSQLDGFMGEVSSSDWDAIASRLDAQEKRRVPFWWVWLTGLLIIGGASSYFLSRDLNQDQQVVISDTTVNPKADRGTSSDPVGDRNNNIPTYSASPENKANEPHLTETQTSGTSNPSAVGTPEAGQTQTGKDETRVEEGTTSPNSKDNIDSKDASGEMPSNNTSDPSEPTEGDQDLPTKNGVDNKSGAVGSKGADTSDFTSETNLVTTPEKDTKTHKKNDKSSKWEIGITASPTWASKLISPNGEHAWKINRRYMDIVDKFEAEGYSYHAGLRVNRVFPTSNGHDWYLSTGIEYNQVAESVVYDYIVDEHVTVSPSRKELTYTPAHPTQIIDVNYTGTNNYKFIEIPVRVGLKTPLIPNERLTLRTEVGIRTMYLADMFGQKTNVTTLTLDDLSQSLSDYEQMSLGINVSAGLYYGLGVDRKYQFGFVPYYNRNITSIRRKDAGIVDKPFNFGLNFSVQRIISIK